MGNIDRDNPDSNQDPIDLAVELAKKIVLANSKRSIHQHDVERYSRTYFPDWHKLLVPYAPESARNGAQFLRQVANWRREKNKLQQLREWLVKQSSPEESFGHRDFPERLNYLLSQTIDIALHAASILEAHKGESVRP